MKCAVHVLASMAKEDLLLPHVTTASLACCGQACVFVPACMFRLALALNGVYQFIQICHCLFVDWGVPVVFGQSDLFAGMAALLRTFGVVHVVFVWRGRWVREANTLTTTLA